jgi:Na+/proline symporter
MTTPDWIVLIAYMAGTVAVGVLLGKLVKNTGDLFAAGRQSPWWMSGLSAFMTMFSANTFVVWGGIAYQHGLVAVMINLCYGIAALAVGFTVAGKWNRLDIRTPAEFIELRFGKTALHFYTWFMMIFRIVGTGGALYAIALLTISVMGSEAEGNLVVSPRVLNTAILVFALIIVIYTMIGGLWAVLMTDTLQFIVLNLAVLFVIPLLLADVGGFSRFFADAPEGFLNLTSSRYTWLFLAGWVAIHYFMVGAEWAFVQRHICVKSPRDAKKGAFLFGGLYLFSPFLWLLPPLLWRVENPIPPGASEQAVLQLSETAYILSCKSVLPTGMLGLMLAALFSATASMISSQLNVFSGVLTNDIYRPLSRHGSDEKHLLRAGRLFTVLLGAVMAGIALLTPVLGGAAKVIIGVTEVMVVPLLAPALAGLIFRRIDARVIWITVGICFPLGLIGKFTPWLDATPLANSTVTGVLLPVLITAILLWLQRNASPSNPLPTTPSSADTTPHTTPSSTRLPITIIAWSLLACAAVLLTLIPINPQHQVHLTIGALVTFLPGALLLLRQSKAS